MKYWNKDQELRTQTWTMINLYNGQPLWNSSFKEKTQWCKSQTSPGKFYHYYHKWWFEYPEDATMFALRWA